MPLGRPACGASHCRAILIAAAACLILAAPALAADGIEYGARPARDEGRPTSGRFELSVGPGSSTSDAVEVLNFTSAPASFDIYAADAVPTSSGGLAPAARSAARTGPATWIVVREETVEVPPRSAATVPFTISVPPGTTVGTTAAALLIEPHEPASSDAIAARTRIGIWVNITVTEGGVQGGRSSPAIPWWSVAVPLVLFGLALGAWLARSTRERRRRWFEDYQEERALLRDLRDRRRLERR